MATSKPQRGILWTTNMTDWADWFSPGTAPPSMADADWAGELAVEPAIDVGHLARMTLGDRNLEHEVLRLFECQADLLLARMNEAAPAGVATLAHTLGGSARGIGARRVAVIAAALEYAAGTAAETAHLAATVAELGAAVAETRIAIAAMLSVAALE
jgi:HPt (histidine-containing phosphotransfer) domain-containing protein